MKQKDYYSWNNNNLLLELQVQPKAQKNAVVGVHNGRLKVTITKPPDNGKANESLLKFFSAYFGIPQKQIKIVKGLQCKYKSILVSDPKNNLEKFKNCK